MSKTTNALLLAGGFAALVIATRTRQIAGVGKLRRGVGLVERFPVSETSHNIVEATSARMLIDSANNPLVHELALGILTNASVEAGTTLDAARALQSYVNNVLPTIPDPPNFERMTDPAEYAQAVLYGGGIEAADCDDKAMLLTALYLSLGFEATMLFMDANNSGAIDHVISVVDVPGHGLVSAETTLPGKELGWTPRYDYAEYLVF